MIASSSLTIIRSVRFTSSTNPMLSTTKIIFAINCYRTENVTAIICASRYVLYINANKSMYTEAYISDVKICSKKPLKYDISLAEDC